MKASFGVAFEGNQPPDIVRAVAQAAEAGGAQTLWIASHLFQREPITVAAMVLAQTRRVGAALMAMSPYTVHPVYATMAAATLDEYFPGRVQLCFGMGAPRDLAAAGIEAPQPRRSLRESVEIARALLGGDTIAYEGRRYRVEGRRLATGRRDIPIVLAASGPQMLELAGALADGVLISAATSPEYIRWSLEQVRRGEAAGQRRIRKMALVYASIAGAERAAHDRLRQALAFVLRGAHHAQNLRLAGTVLDQQALADAFAAEDWGRVAALVSDEVVSRHAASGTPEQVAARFAAYRDVGLEEIVLSRVETAEELRSILDIATA